MENFFETRSPNQYPDYDTGKELSTTDEPKECRVVVDDMSEKEQEDFSFFLTCRRT